MSTGSSPPNRGWLRGLGRTVIVPGVVSLLTDISSEMLYPVIPLFLTTKLAAPMTAVGLIEGVAESTASLLKMAFGWLSDRVARRKPFVVGGYGLSAISKPLMALAGAPSLPLSSSASWLGDDVRRGRDDPHGPDRVLAVSRSGHRVPIVVGVSPVGPVPSAVGSDPVMKGLHPAGNLV